MLTKTQIPRPCTLRFWFHCHRWVGGGACTWVRTPGGSEAGTLSFILVSAPTNSQVWHGSDMIQWEVLDWEWENLGNRFITNLFHFGQVIVSVPQFSRKFDEDNIALPLTGPHVHVNLYKNDLKIWRVWQLSIASLKREALISLRELCIIYYSHDKGQLQITLFSFLLGLIQWKAG